MRYSIKRESYAVASWRLVSAYSAANSANVNETLGLDQCIGTHSPSRRMIRIGLSNGLEEKPSLLHVVDVAAVRRDHRLKVGQVPLRYKP
jgi:hypothetical protein